MDLEEILHEILQRFERLALQFEDGNGGAPDGHPVCYRCDQTGHIARYCTAGGGAERSGRVRNGRVPDGRHFCFRCSRTGHFVRYCTADGGADGGEEAPEEEGVGASAGRPTARSVQWADLPE